MKVLNFTCKLKHFLIIARISYIIVLCVLNMHHVHSNNGDSSTGNYTILDVRICAQGDKISSSYCQCHSSVISCDFSTLSTRDQLITYNIYSETEETVKRFCICNSPKTLHLNLNFLSNHSSSTRNIHRFDLYNLTGFVELEDAFKYYSPGEIYMDGISHLSRIVSNAFGRNDMDIEDVEDLECCSKIRAPQWHPKPVLYVNNSYIEEIQSSGINAIHLWKTVILHNLIVIEVHSEGIQFNSDYGNLSFSIANNAFYNVSKQGFMLKHFENLLFANNVISNYSNDLAFDFRSDLENSHLIVLNNAFDNYFTWLMDAHHIGAWFNEYLIWDNYTFLYLNKSELKERMISVEFNTVLHFHPPNQEIPVINKSSHGLIFNRNVLGTCTCDKYLKANLPRIFKSMPQTCDPRLFPNTTVNLSCVLEIDEFKHKCQQKPTLKPDLEKLCNHQGLQKTFMSTRELLRRMLNKPSARIISHFISEMASFFPLHFHIHQVLEHDEIAEERDLDKLNVSHSKSHSTTAALIWALIVLFCGSVSMIFFRHKLIAWFTWRCRNRGSVVLENASNDNLLVAT